jgi:hypothetical protein
LFLNTATTIFPYEKIKNSPPSKENDFTFGSTVSPLSSSYINHTLLYTNEIQQITRTERKSASFYRSPKNRKIYMDDDSQNEINKYRKFKKVDGATYRKVNQFLRKRTYITAREWALARLCTDFRTSGGAEMTFIGKHLPELVPFMEEPYSPQAVNQARHSFKKKVRKASATFFYGAMCGFFTTDELDDLLFEASEVSRFLLEVEGTTLDIDEEIDIEDRITRVMRSVGETAKTILTQRNDNTMAETINPLKQLTEETDTHDPDKPLNDTTNILPENAPAFLQNTDNLSRSTGNFREEITNSETKIRRETDPAVPEPANAPTPEENIARHDDTSPLNDDRMEPGI